MRARDFAWLVAGLLVACGSDDEGGPKGGSGGSSSGGTAGTGGSTGAAGGTGGQTCVDDPTAPAPSVAVAPVAALTLPKDRADLIATASSPNGSIVAHQWKQVSGPSTAKLHFGDAAHALAVGLAQGSYVFTVEVRDEKCRKATAAVTVDVAAAPPLPSTPAAQLGWLAPPTFKKGHTLPPLSYASCTWSKPNEVAFETGLVEGWGYAYSLHRATAYWNGLMKNPSSVTRPRTA